MDLLQAVVAVLAYQHQMKLNGDQRRRYDEARKQIWDTAELKRLAENE